MEHPFFINNPPTTRPEALRWLSIAEKLLTNRDLIGSKSFATRARESDPTLSLATDQILGIVDTLIAGDKRINNHHYDYYSILQIPNNQTLNSDLIAEQYRRFNLLLNPQNNHFPFADQAFRLIVDAFSVLSNPLRKSMYDKELGFFLNLSPVNFVQHNVYPSSNAHQVFVNLPSQDQGDNQGSHTAGVSFSRDPQAEISMPGTFLTREQETVTSVASSDIEKQPQPQQPQPQQQPATFMRQQQTQQPVTTSISFSNTGEQPATFLSLNQPQPVTSVRSLYRENPNPPFGIGLSSTQGREPPVVVSAEQHGNQQLPETERNENSVVGNNANKSASTSDNVKEKERNVDASDKRIPSFWTACPYCYIMYEYSLDYTDCTLRCQNCKKAFQAVKIASPPPIIDGKEINFCCWGFMPFGLSLEDFDRNIGNNSSWSPFSPMFTCPRFGGDGGSNVNNHAVGGQSNAINLGSSHNAGGSISGGGQKHFAPRIYVDDDDDDVFVEVSEPGEESDEDWSRNKERRKSKNGKRKSARTGTPSKNAKKQQTDKAKTVEGNNDVNLQDGLATQGGVEIPHVDSSNGGLTSKNRRQPGRVAKHFGNLDLNVEFSNEVEEPIIQMGRENEAGEGEDDTVEVIGFFEGLDEFLSSLPILNAVDGDKVEAS